MMQSWPSEIHKWRLSLININYIQLLVRISSIICIGCLHYFCFLDEVFTDAEKCSLDEMKFIPESEDLYNPAFKESPYLELMKIS